MKNTYKVLIDENLTTWDYPYEREMTWEAIQNEIDFYKAQGKEVILKENQYGADYYLASFWVEAPKKKNFFQKILKRA